MNLFERVFNHVKSAGHKLDSSEHQLLNDFVEFLGKEKSIVENFLTSKNIDASQGAVVSNFVAEIAPTVPNGIVADPVETPVAEPIPVIAPVDVTIAAGPAYEEYKAAGNVEPAQAS